MSDEKKPEWVLDDAARAQSAVELEAIDIMQSGLPTCKLCGQRANRLDRFGLCSKTSEPHMEWRAGVRADEKSGARS